jgi:hypothetical protein
VTVEYPIFVEHNGDFVAAVVTTPPSAPRALVLLLQGLGAPRSHRYRLWTRTARALADREIASVRLDYPEMGDSTGTYPLSLMSPPVEEAMRVANVAADALGVSTFGIAGNCLGGRTALGLADRLTGCQSIVSILPDSIEDVLQKEGATATRRAARRLHRMAPRRLLHRVRRSLRSGPPTGKAKAKTRSSNARLRLIPEVFSALRTSRLLLLHLGGEEEGAQLDRCLDEELGRREMDRDRAVVRTIPATNLIGMRLPLPVQPQVIDAIVDWMDRTLPAARTRVVADEVV